MPGPDALEFSWSDDSNIVINRKYAIAVYDNTMGDIVIRYENPFGEDDVVIINMDDAPAIIAAMQKLLPL